MNNSPRTVEEVATCIRRKEPFRGVRKYASWAGCIWFGVDNLTPLTYSVAAYNNWFIYVFDYATEQWFENEFLLDEPYYGQVRPSGNIIRLTDKQIYYLARVGHAELCKARVLGAV